MHLGMPKSEQCEAAVNQLKCQGNQSRVLMAEIKPNVMFSFQKAEEEELQDVQPNLSPKNTRSKPFWTPLPALQRRGDGQKGSAQLC